MGEMNFLCDGDVAAVADRDARGRPLAHAVHRQDCRAFERRGKEGGSRVAQMMFGEEQPARYCVGIRNFTQFVGEQLLLKKLLLEPERYRHSERTKPAWRKSKIRLQQAFEFQKR